MYTTVMIHIKARESRRTSLEYFSINALFSQAKYQTLMRRVLAMLAENQV
jgi:hypothetical protein